MIYNKRKSHLEDKKDSIKEENDVKYSRIQPESPLEDKSTLDELRN